MSSASALRLPLGQRLAHHADLFALIVVLTLGAALRLMLFNWLPVLADGDSFQYYRPAHRLMDGIDFPLPLKRPPAYPWLLALVGLLSGRALEHVVAVQHVLGLATAGLTFGIGRIAFGRTAALIGGLAAAISGELLLWEHYIMTESLFTFLVALATFLFLLGIRSRSALAYIACGTAIGLAALTRPHSQILLLVAPIVLVAHHRGLRTAWRPIGLVIGAALVVLMPWLIRNQLTHGAFTVAGSLGHTLVYKTALLHTGTFVFVDPARDLSDDVALRRTNQLIQRIIDERLKGAGDEWAASTIHSTLQRRLGIDEAEADSLMRRAAIRAILADPVAYLRASAQAFVRISQGVPEVLAEHWHHSRPRDERTRLAALMARPSADQVDRMGDSRLLLDVYQSARIGLVLPTLFALGLAGCVLRPTWRPALFVGLVVLALNGATAATAGWNPRYHHPTVPLVHVIAVGGLLCLGNATSFVVRRLPRWRGFPAAHVSDPAS